MDRTANRLSDKALQHLKPDPAAAYDLSDGGGLHVRVETTGAVVFWLRYQLNGKRRRMVLGHYGKAGVSLAEARARRDAARAQLRSGLDPMLERQRAQREAEAQARAADAAAKREQAKAVHTVAWLVDQFATIELPVQHKRPSWGAQLLGKHVAGVIGAKRLDAVDSLAVWDCLDPLRVDHPQLARHVYGLMRKTFAFGVARGWMTSNPAADIERKTVARKPPSRTVTLTDEAIRHLWHDFANDSKVTRPVWLALKILLATGQRRGELSRAKWSEFDLAAATWTIRVELLGKKKNPDKLKPHVVPLSSTALAVVRELHEITKGSAWVLPSPDDAEKPIDERALTRAVARKALGWTPHDLRRTCRTRLAARPVSAPAMVAELIINHEMPELISVYDQHDYSAEKRAALEAWGREIKRIAGPA